MSSAAPKKNQKKTRQRPARPDRGGRPGATAEPQPSLGHDLWAAGTLAALVAMVGTFVIYGWVDGGWSGLIVVLTITVIIGLVARGPLLKYLRAGGSGGGFAFAVSLLVVGLAMLLSEF